MADELKDLLGPTPACPPLEELAEARHERHRSECGYCAAQFALYQEFEQAVPSKAEKLAVDAIVANLRKQSPVAAKPWWSRVWRMPVLIPAAAAVAALLVTVTIYKRPSMEPIGGGGEGVVRSVQVRAIAPLGEIRAVPENLSWQPVPGAAQYSVRVLEVDRTEIWRGATPATVIELPASVRAQIAPGRKLLWETTAMDAGGRTIASSGAQSFFLAP